MFNNKRLDYHRDRIFALEGHIELLYKKNEKLQAIVAELCDYVYKDKESENKPSSADCNYFTVRDHELLKTVSDNYAKNKKGAKK